MKFDFLWRFPLGLGLVALLSSCGGLNSPDDWAQAPMPGVAGASTTPKPEAKPATKVPKKATAAEESAPESDEPSWWSRQKEKRDKKSKVEQSDESPVVKKKAPPQTVPSPEAKPAVKSIGGYPVATRSDFWRGNVISPYDGRMINVSSVASGSLVADPRYPLDQKKYFVVP